MRGTLKMCWRWRCRSSSRSLWLWRLRREPQTMNCEQEGRRNCRPYSFAQEMAVNSRATGASD
jgi:hypothetical protein